MAFREIRVAQIGFFDIGVRERRGSQVSAEKIGAAQSRIHQDCITHPRVGKIGLAQIRPGQIGFLEIGTLKIGAKEFHAVENCRAQICFTQICSAKIGLGEIRTLQIGLPEMSVSPKRTVALSVAKPEVIELRAFDAREIVILPRPIFRRQGDAGLGQVGVWPVAERPKHIGGPPLDAELPEVRHYARVVRHAIDNSKRENEKKRANDG